MKVNVIGTSGSGKSTFAAELAEATGLPYIELDKVFWEKDWQMPDDATFFARLKDALSPESWVLDGNYSRSIPVKWESVDYVIWLDFPYIRTVFQAIRRALSRVITKVELWEGTGNRESWTLLFSKESIVLWTLRTYHPNRRKIQSYFESPEYKHIRFIRVSNQRERNRLIRQFVESLRTGQQISGV